MATRNILGSPVVYPTVLPASDGQVLTADMDGTSSWETPSSGGGLTWAGVSGTSQAAAVNTGYIVQNAGQTTITLPATAAIGDIVAVAGLGAAGWVLQANGGQSIKAGSVSAGNLTSANQYDQIEVVCLVANTTWGMRSSVTAGFEPA